MFGRATMRLGIGPHSSNDYFSAGSPTPGISGTRFLGPDVLPATTEGNTKH